MRNPREASCPSHQWDASSLWTRKEALTRNGTHQHLDTGLLSLQSMRNVWLLFKLPNLWYYCSSPNRLRHRNCYSNPILPGNMIFHNYSMITLCWFKIKHVHDKLCKYSNKVSLTRCQSAISHFERTHALFAVLGHIKSCITLVHSYMVQLKARHITLDV